METSLETFVRPDLFVAYLFASSELLMTAGFAWLEDYAEAFGMGAAEPEENDRADS
ncbi:hypothetical protein K9U39_18620 [Rhodoblastus acidophilus]|uniref:Uncharacterized protein n=1 Tax=Candidatus Rhodoblastus alkanivorans TaxID=2954117 RepID=A0ABS9Z3W9_9HYPH|nr:hypothetical protein [Candidatus Rhodoblastus alkanivorans]MCI4677513.1 hypothetical protein [Candidatus Rhodoblastus alkanivorans]MCI4681872.1 hypothetical protein [Candidatus Rhodoblastus alkanivorans]MDI4642922.1 hypothetical protein [Rhodoblastus acidophilus]